VFSLFLRLWAKRWINKLKISQRLLSTKRFQLGGSLGMSGVYSIVKRYKGEIVVTASEINEGTTMEIIFPIHL
tara:strand:+ start:1252 stop:1470 length:219 start_codon:yes stop_codon:yes gene_type:complete